MVHRLLAHWRDAQGEGEFPSLDAILKGDLGDILPSIFVLKVPADAGEPAFARVGESFAGEVSGDLTGRPVSAAPEGTLLEQAVGIYDEVLAKKVPITRDGEFEHVQCGTVLYRSIILPLSEGQGTIDFLLGAANFKTKDEEGAGKFDAPPLKPFPKKGLQTPGKPPAQGAFRAEIPGRVVAFPSSPRPIERGRPVDAENKKLIVGQDIRFSGEITSCDRLVVEGRVEASLTNARVIEVAPSGFFKGDAQVEEADISGLYEGTLIAYDKLTVRTGGRVSGSIRYGNIIIETGGEISGDMHALSQEEQAESREEAETPDETADTPTLSPEKA